MSQITEAIDEFKQACIIYGACKEGRDFVEETKTWGLLEVSNKLLEVATKQVDRAQRKLEELVIPSEPIAEVGTLAESTGE